MGFFTLIAQTNVKNIESGYFGVKSLQGGIGSLRQYEQQIYQSQSLLYNCNMKNQLDEGNYESIINKLVKGTADEKSASLRKLNFLYENARSRIYLYERRITESLELLLLMEEKDIANLTLNLLQKIIINTVAESELFSIIKKRLLSKMVLNLGSVDITTRRISHKCILQYVRKLRDYQSIIPCYIKIGIQQSENYHLKLKAISSFHSLVAEESKSFTHGTISSQVLLEQLIYSSFQKQNVQIRRVAILCLIQILRIYYADKTLKMINSLASKQLNDLKSENAQLARLIDSLMKTNIPNMPNQASKQQSMQLDSTPSPKFMSITQQQLKKQLGNMPHDLSIEMQRAQKGITQAQLKLLTDVSFAEQFLKKLQTTGVWQLDEIKEFAPHLQKYLVDESIKLFSISKKIVQVILDSDGQQQRQYYVILVPCVVNGIGNKRFIVRKHLDKLVRQFIRNHTEVWVQNFIERIASTNNSKIKQILLQLFMHAYRTSPEFYHPYQRTFSVMERQIKDTYSNLKWKALDCIIAVIEKQPKNDKKQEMMSTLSPEVYHKIMRKMNKTHNSIGSNESLEPISPLNRKRKVQKRLIRLTTDDPLMYEGEDREYIRRNNISQEKIELGPISKERKIRKSQADIEIKTKKSRRARQKQSFREEPASSITKLPQLKRNNLPSISSQRSKNDIIATNQSPVKKSIGQRNIMYVDKQNLPEIQDPRYELEKALTMIKENSWNTQFDSISCLRSLIQHHKELITEDVFAAIMNQLLQCLNNLRSGVSKIALICLGQLISKFKKRSYPFTQQVVSTLLKKSLTTSDFIQEQIKKCIWIAAQQLCPNRLISSLSSLKQNAKGAEFKISILSMIDAICNKNQKVYKKEIEWIWGSLIEFHEDHNLNVKNQARKITRNLIDSHPTWKNDIAGLRVIMLQKIDRIIKSIISNGSSVDKQQNWLESQNKQLSKIIQSKTINPKFFMNQLAKLQQLDKQCLAKKNLRERSKVLANSFSYAIEYPQEFVQYPQWRKYVLIALDHVDQKNPGLLLNSLQILTRCLDSQTIVEAISEDEPLSINILQKTIIASQTKRPEMGSVINNFISNFYAKIGYGKCCKQLLKLLLLSLCATSNATNNNQTGNLSSGYQIELYLNKIIDILKQNYQNSPRKKPVVNLQNILQSKHIYRKSEYSQYEQNQNESKESQFDCIQSYITRVINRQASDPNLSKPIFNKFKQMLVLCSIIMSPNVYERILLNPKAKSLLNEKQLNDAKQSADHKNLRSAQKTESKESTNLHPAQNRSQPKERPRNKIKSGDRRFRRRDLQNKARDLSKENEKDIRGSHN